MDGEGRHLLGQAAGLRLGKSRDLHEGTSRLVGEDLDPHASSPDEKRQGEAEYRDERGAREQDFRRRRARSHRAGSVRRYTTSGK